MKTDFRYLATSGVRESASGASVAFSPNLAREKVFFDGELLFPIRQAHGIPLRGIPHIRGGAFG